MTHSPNCDTIKYGPFFGTCNCAQIQKEEDEWTIKANPFTSWYTFESQDAIEQPEHYTFGGFEAIDIIKAKLTPEEFRGFLKGNVLKYMMRANYKNQHNSDCKKASWYANKLKKELDNE